MELQLKIIGGLLIALALVHIFFPAYFGWKKELQSISLINRQVMYVHTFFIAIIIFLMGVFCIYCTTDIIYTKLGKQFSLALSVFWGLRLFFQFFIYSPKLWKRKYFETIIHIVFSILWAYLTIIFFLVYVSK